MAAMVVRVAVLVVRAIRVELALKALTVVQAVAISQAAVVEIQPLAAMVLTQMVALVVMVPLPIQPTALQLELDKILVEPTGMLVAVAVQAQTTMFTASQQVETVAVVLALAVVRLHFLELRTQVVAAAALAQTEMLQAQAVQEL
jgi:hypothetical protein